LLAGWLTIATANNVLTALTAKGLPTTRTPAAQRIASTLPIAANAFLGFVGNVGADLARGPRERDNLMIPTEGCGYALPMVPVAPMITTFMAVSSWLLAAIVRRWYSKETISLLITSAA
jgi:hypothetical protein